MSAAPRFASTAAALLLASLPSAAAPASKTAAPVDPAATRKLARENAILEKTVELAKGKEFYLLLDPRAGTLKLLLNATELQTFKLHGIEVGAPRVAFVSRGLPDDWEGRIWSGGELAPARERDRLEIQAPPPTKEGQEPNIPVPPTPEEAYPVPPVYHVRFKGGLSLEIRNTALEPSDRGFWSRLGDRTRRWWADLKSALGSGDPDTVRLHVIMSKKDADSFYRALPPNTKLLVLPPTS